MEPISPSSWATNVLYEVRSEKIRRGSPILVPYSELHNYSGFRSLYGYGPEAQEQIGALNSTADLSGMPVYSDLLLVDFDAKPQEGHSMAEALHLYDWVLFDSGGRSLHLHIRIEPMYGGNVPAIQKAWMAENFPEADLSIYRTAGIYRMAGTYHSGGRIKRVLRMNETGNALKLIVTPRDEYAGQNFETTGDADHELQLFLLVGREVPSGHTGRNYHAYKIAKVCKHLGMGPVEAEWFVACWNESRCLPPLPVTNIRATVKSAYRETHNGNTQRSS